VYGGRSAEVVGAPAERPWRVAGELAELLDEMRPVEVPTFGRQAGPVAISRPRGASRQLLEERPARAGGVTAERRTFDRADRAVEAQQFRGCLRRDPDLLPEQGDESAMAGFVPSNKRAIGTV
jgi:hypothetical protein